MKKPFITSVTLFKSLFKTKDTAYILPIEDVYLRIKEGIGGTKELIEQIRSITDKEERNDKKKQLKAILFAGEFNQRNDAGLIKHSGLMVTDFDDFESEEKLLQWREILQSCPFAYLVFRSPSGNGLKAVIRIPESNSDNHALRHDAFLKYINCEYFDKVNKNVSRVCFESYDPEIYINQYAEIFELISENKGYEYTNRPPIVILRNEQEIINRLVKFDFDGNFTEGNRNNYIFKVACCFSEYGIDKETCENYLWNNVANGSFDHQEFLQTVKSAYRKTTFNTKYFEDTQKVEKIKKDITRGATSKDIIEKHGVDQETIEDVKEKIKSEDEVFWEIIKRKNGSIDISINEWKYQKFLIKNGFSKYYPEGAEKPNFVRVIENKVNLISSDQIKDFVLNHLAKSDNIDVWNFCSRATYLFTEKYLNFIESINLLLLEDTKDICYLPFKNGVVKVTKDDYFVIPFLDVDGYIWEKQIIDRNFTKINSSKTDFDAFIKNITNKNEGRYNSFISTIGYLIHAHKNKSEQKAIIFNDEEIDENPNGGSGKSLVLTAVSKFRRMVKIDGKTFSPTKSDFVYQRVSVDTQILAFDDVKKNFDFESLFSLITEGIPVNRKNKDEFYIPFERSPKIVITTNYIINGAGGSHDRRRHEVEFFQFYNAGYSPKDNFGKYFFDEWNSDEWNEFDNFIIKCIQFYLNNGLVQVVSLNSDNKRFIQSTCQEFYEFVREYPIYKNKQYFTTDLLIEFINENQKMDKISTKLFVSWFKHYCNIFGYQLEKGKCNDTKKRWLKVVDDRQKIEVVDEKPEFPF
jgi:hypothetical protein